MADRVSPFTAKAQPSAAKARWIAPFLRKNLDALEEALKVTLARSTSGNLLAPLGYGEFGAAFATDDGRVVKITTDDAEPVIGHELLRLQHGEEGAELQRAARGGFTRLDRIVQMPGKVRHQGHDVPVFALLREDVMPVMSDREVPSPILDALNAHFDGWAAWFDLDKKRTKTAAMKLDTSMQILDGWDAVDSEPALEDFARVQRYLWNLGIPLMDTYAKNFGWRQTATASKLVLFDLGGSLPLGPKDLVDPIDADAFTAYYPWKETLKKVERA